MPENKKKSQDTPDEVAVFLATRSLSSEAKQAILGLMGYLDPIGVADENDQGDETPAEPSTDTGKGSTPDPRPKK